MGRSFTADDLVTLPKLDARSALALGAALLTAAQELVKTKKVKALPKSIAKKHAAFAEAVKHLRAVSASRLGTTNEDSPRAQAIDRLLDAAWSGFFDWLTGWSKLPNTQQAKKASAIRADLFPEGLKFIQLAYVIEWSESATRLERIATAKHDEAIEELGGGPFLKSLRSHQKDYGDALGLTEVPGQAVTATVREALDGFASALRKYALAVTAYGEDDDNGKDAPEIAEALLASLASWEATAGKSRPEGEGAGGEIQGDAAPPAAEKDAEAGGTAEATGEKPAGGPT